MATHAVDELEAWLDRSFSREHSGDYSDLKLGPLAAVLARLPTPPDPVTAAGTKGKGSTLRLLEAMLLAHDRATVAFASPHVHSVLERWRLDGAVVDLATATAAAERVAAAEAGAAAELTYFERCFAIACVLAAERPEAVFLCEVGLGGRLDCANLLDARIALCTHLSRDHCHVLGDTLTAIAGEKLAIARPDRPLLIAPQSPEAAAAVRSRLPPTQVCWVDRAEAPRDWVLGLAGSHQRDNLATALVAARRLLGDAFDPALARAAVADTRWTARCQFLPHPAFGEVLVDGAHNGPSVAATLATARERWGRPFQLVLGLARDKELAEIEAAIPADQTVVRCGYPGPRVRGPTEWSTRSVGWPWADDVAAALATLEAGSPVCITGSFYLAAEALDHLAQP